MAASDLRKRLFRLIITLKIAMWGTIAAVLVIGIWDVVRGSEDGPPMTLIYAIPALIVAQLIAIFAWRRTGGPK
ncbi:MAG: hypothetical protein P8J20_04845 [Novosphingobium sp.]|nr:hypothetical protein [Novosphingobium sp.]